MDYILFDLDGTITNPKLGITKSFQYALNSRGIYVESLDDLTKHIGPPLQVSLREYGFNEEEALELIDKYREYYSTTGIYENEVYEGMEELFQRLKQSGKRLYTATSKAEKYARIIMEHFGLSQYFDDICGATMDSSRSEKQDVIRYALMKNNITDYSRVVMIGDRRYDIEGAKKVGISSIGVLFGYGSRQELTLAGADRIASTVAEIYDLVMNM